MEDNIQVIVGVIISVFLLFVFPVYMAYEKKDDVSYTLAMRYTQVFVDEVRNKGYITKDMLDTYKSRLFATGNSYEIELIHKQTRMDPVTKYYDIQGTKQVLVKTTTQEERLEYEESVLAPYGPGLTETQKKNYIQNAYVSQNIDKVVDTYAVSEETYTTNHIEAILQTENKLWLGATTENFVCIDDDETEDLTSLTKRVKGCEYVYTMNEDDDFTVTIKNTNTTLATLMYNMVTANAVDNNVRIFVTYSATILNEKWYGRIDYSKMKHDNLNLYDYEYEKTIFLDAKKYKKDGTGADHVYLSDIQYETEYTIEFEVKPFEVTELRPKWHLVTDDEKPLYNVAVSRYVEPGHGMGSLVICVGLNGIALINVESSYLNAAVILVHPMTITEYINVKVRVQKSDADPSKYVAVLYVNGERVDESVPVSTPMYIHRVGKGYIGNVPVYFGGYIRNLRIYY